MAADTPKVHVAGDPVETLDKPIFDFSRVNYKRGREGSILNVRIQHLSNQINAASPTDDIDSLITKFNTLVDQQEPYLVEAIVHIPQSWLVVSAPPTDSIDWSDTASLQWMRSDKMAPLGKAKQEAQTGIGPN